jgi:hypothetical protein
MKPSVFAKTLTKKIPPRQRSAMTGSEFAEFVSGMQERQREAAILDQLLQGNLPDFLRRLEPVRLYDRCNNEKFTTAIIFVMPDYLAIGSNQNFIRIPMNYFSAAAVAGRFGFVLPTKKMVDAIYEQSICHFRPQPMKPGPQMRSTGYYRSHNDHINRQRISLGIPLGKLSAGHKKDIVITKRLVRKQKRVAIYGWHRLSGIPIQPLSTVHGAGYADYSHGARMVSDKVLIDGTVRSIYAILRDPDLAQVFSDEGPIPSVSQILTQTTRN